MDITTIQFIGISAAACIVPPLTYVLGVWQGMRRVDKARTHYIDIADTVIKTTNETLKVAYDQLKENTATLNRSRRLLAVLEQITTATAKGKPSVHKRDGEED